MQSYTE